MSHVTESLNRESKSHTLSRPIKVIQFGEGNFLRAFVDWIIQELNDQTAFNGSVKVIQPIPRGYGDKINEQDGLYHVVLKGYEGEHFRSTTHLIDVIEEAINPYQQFETFLKEAENPELEYIISNTTEAGITLNENDKITDEPASSYPGKLLQFLHHRYRTLPNSKPVYLLPCELIDQNASKLKEIIYLLSAKWKLGNYFNTWLGEKIFFCNTLVDRIVPGFPKEYAPGIWDDIGVKDELLVEGELFHLWVIEGPESLKERLPFFQTNLNVILTNNLKEFRERKVRILNGLHTAIMPLAYLMGLRTVKESVENERILRFHTCALNEEILPTLEGDPDELKAYSDEILRRFKNPAIRHELISISLNSFSKFKTRVLPSIIELHHVEGKLAKHLLFSLAALICFYRGSWNDFPIELSDDPYVLEKLTELWKTKSIAEIVSELLSDKSIWDHDLTQIPGLKERVTLNLSSIVARGVSQALNDLLD